MTTIRLQNRVVNFLFYEEAEGDGMSFGASEANCIGSSCVDHIITLFINAEPVLQVQDQAFSSGFAGMMTGTLAASGLMVHFHNFILLTP